MERKRFVLVDGHSLAYRAFYALPSEMSTSSGQTTNAVYGFLSMLIKILEDFHPFGLAVAFDKGEPTYRTEQYADYKAQRPPTPPELHEQLKLIGVLLERMGVAQLEMEGYEADDILATLAVRLADCGHEVLIVTSDKDFLQLVDDNIKVVANRKGLTDVMVFDRERVEERYGVPPCRIADFLALRGDKSDNIPGVAGIGDKTAARLIQEYGGVFDIYADLGRIKDERLRKRLEKGRETVMLGMQLVGLVIDLPLSADEGCCRLRPWNSDSVTEFLSSLEIRALARKLEGLKGQLFPEWDEGLTEGGERASDDGSDAGTHFHASLQEAGPEILLSEASEKGKAYIIAETEGSGSSLSLLSLAAAAGQSAITLRDAHSDGMEGKTVGFLRGLVFGDWELVGHGSRDLQLYLLFKGIDPPVMGFDTELAAYLLDPTMLDYRLERLSRVYLGGSEKTMGGQLSLQETKADPYRENMRKLAILKDLEKPLREEIETQGMAGLMQEVELPLQKVLARMEHTGVAIDTDLLRELSNKTGDRLLELEEKAYALAGERFNISSPKQLARVLFEKLRLPPQKKTKTGYSTDVEVLEALAGRHPLVPLLLEVRELQKLKGTYLDALPRLVDPVTGRIHARFNQTVTATGRISSSNPNLQNIPVRTPAGSEIRRAFVPGREGWCLVVADYSQIELRILAHLSGDENMCEAFRRGEDIHARTASEVFKVPLSEVTSEQRRKAKAINFGLLYGMGSASLGKQIGASEEEARGYMEAYFSRYPAVKDYLEDAVKKAEKRGWTETIMGRRRQVSELSSPNGRVKSLGARLAMNAPIQGSAADIIKLAMVRIDRLLDERGMGSRIILQVHDELLLETPEAERDEMVMLLRSVMEGAASMRVPLLVEVGYGANWKEAKPG